MNQYIMMDNYETSDIPLIKPDESHATQNSWDIEVWWCGLVNGYPSWELSLGYSLVNDHSY
jgi:hypothetical protein